eukprot:gene11680-biopygen1746
MESSHIVQVTCSHSLKYGVEEGARRWQAAKAVMYVNGHMIPSAEEGVVIPWRCVRGWGGCVEDAYWNVNNVEEHLLRTKVNQLLQRQVEL